MIKPNPNESGATPIRALVLREGAPATVEAVTPSSDGFSAVVGNKPMMIGMTSEYSLVLSSEPDESARPNLRVVDAGGPGMGLIAGACFVVKHNDSGRVVSLDDGDVVALRGYLEARRVGSC